ncbi:hypothetical protein TNCV_1985141 [Trichonephila clavipes]|nr:hypothetical protein TNCV_1985141 [Trichonephila clavipes]
MVICFQSKPGTLCDTSLMATMMINCDTAAGDSADVVWSKANVLKAAVRVTPSQPSAVKWWKVPQKEGE